jgi:GNAT superfamily N-acetyltransferase
MCKTSTHPDACDGETGYKGACASCPFNEGMTEEADQAQGYGCLPSGYDIIQMKQRSGQNWACHSNENKVCAGLCHQAKDRDLDLSQGGLIRYSSWFHAGEQAALDEAATGVLVQEFSGHYFDLALYGNRLADGTREAPTIAHPTLKYYYPEPGLVSPYDKSLDTHRFWAATTAPELDADSGLLLRKVIGLLEVETSPFDAKVLWMRYVSVAPEHQRRGIAKRLLAGLVQHLKKTGQTLERSTASEEGRLKIQAYIDGLLAANGIAWKQNNR